MQQKGFEKFAVLIWVSVHWEQIEGNESPLSARWNARFVHYKAQNDMSMGISLPRGSLSVLFTCGDDPWLCALDPNLRLAVARDVSNGRASNTICGVIRSAGNLSVQRPLTHFIRRQKAYSSISPTPSWKPDLRSWWVAAIIYTVLPPATQHTVVTCCTNKKLASRSLTGPNYAANVMIAWAENWNEARMESDPGGRLACV